MNLSSRLQTIAKMVPLHGTVFDVGSDHGKLIIYLVENNLIKFAYGGENKSGPYNILKSHLDTSKNSEKLKAIYQDGILTVPSDVNVLTICGMGGTLINDILSAHKENLKNISDIIIDAHNAIGDVRRFITSLGFYIKEEAIIKERNIFYEIIHFERGHKNYSEQEYDFGPLLMKNKEDAFITKWNKKIEQNLKVINKIDNSSRIEELEIENERIRKVL